MFCKNRFLISLLLAALLQMTAVNAAPSIGGYNVYYGDLHNHCDVDGTSAVGTPTQAYDYARNTAHFDFLGLTPHDHNISSTEWNTLKTAANNANLDGTFVAFRGFEWTSSTLGHIAILNSSDYCTSSQSATNTFAEICTWIGARAEAGCIAFFNHPGRNNSTGVEFNHFVGTPISNLVGMELWNKTQSFSVYYYNDGYYGSDNNKGHFDEALARHWKVGASGSGDNHSGTWGTAQDSRLAILAPSLTHADLLAAIQARRFFSTLDKNIALSFKINDNEMGSTLAGQNNQSLRVLATDGDKEVFTEVMVFNKSHNIIVTWAPNAASVDESLSLDTFAGEYFYAKVKQADGDEAISSPIWISGGQVNTTPVPSDTARDGVSPDNNLEKDGNCGATGFEFVIFFFLGLFRVCLRNRKHVIVR